jgi:thiol-disulfide isomerase/thioredoxin
MQPTWLGILRLAFCRFASILERQQWENQLGMKRSIYYLTLGLIACATAMSAPAPSLKVGDPAPKLQPGKWVQGEPVKAFEKDKAYIVEFWATWCGPCRVSIPHLNEIHQKYKDKGLVVIGQDCCEQDDSPVAPFVKEMGEKMTYRVALDDKSDTEKGIMAKTWMEAAGQNGIPTAFLIDGQGMVAWIGHPMTLKEKTIEQVLDKSFDLKKAVAEYAEQKEREVKMRSLSRQLGQAMQNRDWEKAEATVGKMKEGLPEDERDGLASVRMDILLGKGDPTGAAALALKLSDANKENAMLQNELAWKLATQKDLSKDALETAAKIAVRANDSAKGKDPAVLDTLARVRFLQGNNAAATELQEKAVSLAKGPMKEQFQATLNSYKKGKLPAAE